MSYTIGNVTFPDFASPLSTLTNLQRALQEKPSKDNFEFWQFTRALENKDTHWFRDFNATFEQGVDTNSTQLFIVDPTGIDFNYTVMEDIILNRNNVSVAMLIKEDKFRQILDADAAQHEGAQRLLSRWSEIKEKVIFSRFSQDIPRQQGLNGHHDISHYVNDLMTRAKHQLGTSELSVTLVSNRNLVAKDLITHILRVFDVELEFKAGDAIKTHLYALTQA